MNTSGRESPAQDRAVSHFSWYSPSSATSPATDRSRYSGHTGGPSAPQQSYATGRLWDSRYGRARSSPRRSSRNRHPWRGRRSTHFGSRVVLTVLTSADASREPSPDKAGVLNACRTVVKDSV